MKPSKQHPEDVSWIFVALGIAIGVPFYIWYQELGYGGQVLTIVASVLIVVAAILMWFSYFSRFAEERNQKKEIFKEIPLNLRTRQKGSLLLGKEADLTVPIFFPDSIRSRHVHILGATGAGKTESVILNFLRQDIALGRGAIILDAKGDDSFGKYLKKWLPEEKLAILDLADEKSFGFDPLKNGSYSEAALRLHSSLSWSESYYKSKALTALLRIFEELFKKHNKNPNIEEVNRVLYDADSFASLLSTTSKENKILEASFEELAGLRDQIKALTLGNLESLLSPKESDSQIDLFEAVQGKVIYFRLQSLVSPQTVASIGKLIINNINFLAGKTHREQSEEGEANKRELVPIYLDEFAAFASPEFAPLIAMARSAGFALHFSHQSVGDLINVGKGFINQITDNSGTKIVLRVNDPDTAEYFARTFGTRLIKKITQRITNTDSEETGELVGEGSSREAHQFRASPDLLKTLPTGMAACLIAHGENTSEGASHVFKIKFPRLEEKVL